MTRTMLALLFATAFVVSAASAVPMEFALGLFSGQNTAIAARAVTGTIWNARMQDLRIDGFRAGNASVRLDPLSLMMGTRRLDISSARGEAVLVDGELKGAEHVRASIGGSELGLPFATEGTVRLNDVTLLFQNGNCHAASGRIATDAFAVFSKGLELAGNLRCEDAAGIADLLGRNEEAEVALALRFQSDGGYRAETRVRNASPARREALLLAGFDQIGGDLVRADQGRMGP